MTDDVTSKPNRRKRLEAKRHAMVVDPPPPTGIHRENKKDIARKKAERIRKARRS